MTNPSPPPHPKTCISENVLNTKCLTADRPSEQVQVLTVSWFRVNVTVLGVCVNVHFTLVHREGSVLESVRATAWRTR